MEDADRSAGIKVDYGGIVVTDSLVTVTGVLHTVNGEKQISALSVVEGSGGSVPEPVGSTACSVAETNGATTRGLLAALWGRVTWVDELAGCFYIDDGRGYLDGTTHDAGGGDMQPNIGVRVQCDYVPYDVTVGKYVTVQKGCVGNYKAGDIVIPIVWVQSDWEIIVTSGQ